jgi:hypothetical protein
VLLLLLAHTRKLLLGSCQPRIECVYEIGHGRTVVLQSQSHPPTYLLRVTIGIAHHHQQRRRRWSRSSTHHV